MAAAPLRFRVWRHYADLPWELDRYDHPAPKPGAPGVSPALEIVEVMPVSEHAALQAEHLKLQGLVRDALGRMDALALRNMAKLPDGDYQAEVVRALNALRDAVPGA